MDIKDSNMGNELTVAFSQKCHQEKEFDVTENVQISVVGQNSVVLVKLFQWMPWSHFTAKHFTKPRLLL